MNRDEAKKIILDISQRARNFGGYVYFPNVGAIAVDFTDIEPEEFVRLLVRQGFWRFAKESGRKIRATDLISYAKDMTSIQEKQILDATLGSKWYSFVKDLEKEPTILRGIKSLGYGLQYGVFETAPEIFDVLTLGLASRVSHFLQTKFGIADEFQSMFNWYVSQNLKNKLSSDLFTRFMGEWVNYTGLGGIARNVANLGGFIYGFGVWSKLLTSLGSILGTKPGLLGKVGYFLATPTRIASLERLTGQNLLKLIGYDFTLFNALDQITNVISPYRYGATELLYDILSGRRVEDEKIYEALSGFISSSLYSLLPISGRLFDASLGVVSKYIPKSLLRNIGADEFVQFISKAPARDVYLRGLKDILIENIKLGVVLTPIEALNRGADTVLRKVLGIVGAEIGGSNTLRDVLSTVGLITLTNTFLSGVAWTRLPDIERRRYLIAKKIYPLLEIGKIKSELLERGDIYAIKKAGGITGEEGLKTPDEKTHAEVEMGKSAYSKLEAALPIEEIADKVYKSLEREYAQEYADKIKLSHIIDLIHTHFNDGFGFDFSKISTSPSSAYGLVYSKILKTLGSRYNFLLYLSSQKNIPSSGLLQNPAIREIAQKHLLEVAKSIELETAGNLSVAIGFDKPLKDIGLPPVKYITVYDNINKNTYRFNFDGFNDEFIRKFSENPDLSNLFIRDIINSIQKELDQITHDRQGITAGMKPLLVWWIGERIAGLSKEFDLFVKSPKEWGDLHSLAISDEASAVLSFVQKIQNANITKTLQDLIDLTEGRALDYGEFGRYEVRLKRGIIKFNDTPLEFLFPVLYKISPEGSYEVLNPFKTHSDAKLIKIEDLNDVKEFPVMTALTKEELEALGRLKGFKPEGFEELVDFNTFMNAENLANRVLEKSGKPSKNEVVIDLISEEKINQQIKEIVEGFIPKQTKIDEIKQKQAEFIKKEQENIKEDIQEFESKGKAHITERLTNLINLFKLDLESYPYLKQKYKDYEESVSKTLIRIREVLNDVMRLYPGALEQIYEYFKLELGKHINDLSQLNVHTEAKPFLNAFLSELSGLMLSLDVPREVIEKISTEGKKVDILDVNLVNARLLKLSRQMVELARRYALYEYLIMRWNLSKGKTTQAKDKDLKNYIRSNLDYLAQTFGVDKSEIKEWTYRTLTTYKTRVSNEFKGLFEQFAQDFKRVYGISDVENKAKMHIDLVEKYFPEYVKDNVLRPSLEVLLFKDYHFLELPEEHLINQTLNKEIDGIKVSQYIKDRVIEKIQSSEGVQEEYIPTLIERLNDFMSKLNTYVGYGELVKIIQSKYPSKVENGEIYDIILIESDKIPQLIATVQSLLTRKPKKIKEEKVVFGRTIAQWREMDEIKIRKSLTIDELVNAIAEHFINQIVVEPTEIPIDPTTQPGVINKIKYDPFEGIKEDKVIDLTHAIKNLKTIIEPGSEFATPVTYMRVGKILKNYYDAFVIPEVRYTVLKDKKKNKWVIQVDKISGSDYYKDEKGNVLYYDTKEKAENVVMQLTSEEKERVKPLIDLLQGINFQDLKNPNMNIYFEDGTQYNNALKLFIDFVSEFLLFPYDYKGNKERYNKLLNDLSDYLYNVLNEIRFKNANAIRKDEMIVLSFLNFLKQNLIETLPNVNSSEKGITLGANFVKRIVGEVFPYIYRGKISRFKYLDFLAILEQLIQVGAGLTGLTLLFEPELFKFILKIFDEEYATNT